MRSLKTIIFSDLIDSTRCKRVETLVEMEKRLEKKHSITDLMPNQTLEDDDWWIKNQVAKPAFVVVFWNQASHTFSLDLKEVSIVKY